VDIHREVQEIARLAIGYRLLTRGKKEMHRSTLIAVVGIASVLLLMASLPGCGKSEEPAVTPSEPEYAAAIVDGIMQAFNAGDYAAYSEHFDEAMKKALNETVFRETGDFIRKKIGDYISREVTQVKVEEIYTTVVYKAKFTDEPEDVKVTVSFLETEDYVFVSGMWFDSPKLRGQ
jgi:hypothetical protein